MRKVIGYVRREAREWKRVIGWSLVHWQIARVMRRSGR